MIAQQVDDLLSWMGKCVYFHIDIAGHNTSLFITYISTIQIQKQNGTQHSSLVMHYLY
jgi:hypothetical protein